MGPSPTAPFDLTRRHQVAAVVLPRFHPALELFFQLVSSGYGRASLIVTSNKTVRPLGEVFGDDVVATAMIDRLVHHAEVAAL